MWSSFERITQTCQIKYDVKPFGFVICVSYLFTVHIQSSISWTMNDEDEAMSVYTN